MVHTDDGSRALSRLVARACTGERAPDDLRARLRAWIRAVGPAHLHQAASRPAAGTPHAG